MRVVLTGGGTGGHITPFGPIIEALHEHHVTHNTLLPKRLVPKRLDIYFVGVAGEGVKEYFAKYNVTVVHVPSGKLRRYFSFHTIIDLGYKLPFGFVWALMRMWWIMPDVVISKGGYGSMPVGLAAFIYRIPLLLHESDAVMGLSNKILAASAAALGVGFDDTRGRLSEGLQRKTFVTGTPVRPDLHSYGREESRALFGIRPQQIALLVLGGSQGAQQINEAFLQVLTHVVSQAVVIHVTGTKHFEVVKGLAGDLLVSSAYQENYRPFAYLTDKMVPAMVAADVVITRAGASTLAELASLRKPCLIIPLAGSANDHQRLNAEVYEVAGAARVLDPNNLGPTLFARNIDELIADSELRERLSTHMTKLDFTLAARDIAELSFKLASGLRPTISRNAS